MNHRLSLLRVLRAACFLFGLSAVTLVLRSHDAHAGWPPQPGDDLTNPANWPNDPGYASQWNYWSYLPQQQPNTLPYTSDDMMLGASGMSVDKAWTYSTGSPQVLIAVIDSGIEWDRADLIHKEHLNLGELGKPSQKPLNAMGQACGGTGALAGYDCVNDGVLTVADYEQDPRLTPVVTGDKCFQGGDPSNPGSDRIMGDVNHNCFLDAGDLIELFSDKVDDDNNGYTDDISGWDFFKNDNDPYDDVRYGHGTGESSDSSAEGNNKIDSLGVCPNCRVMMMRAGNSFVADANDFAKGVVYAADNGANVVQEALGTVNQTAFSRAAIDYAYGKNVVVVASMADENSRHHNVPALANHTLPVHAITYNGPDYNSSNTFLAFNTCTNYGGQLMLSVSGRSCSSEATGRDSGVTGLIFSYALAQNPPLTLTAEEVMQIEKQTADDINVPESRSNDPNVAALYYESKPGFDQRFGYGRVNVARAMQVVQSGLIPPEVDIVAPDWFETLYADRVTGPVPIIGRVLAKRAMAYDVVVQWAPGVEPDDSLFQPLGPPLMNVPGATPTGGPNAPLATIDPRVIDTTHPPDPDSPHHENDRTVTLRVQVVAHYPTGDTKGEARRTIAIVNQKNGLDPDLLPGFPIRLTGSAEPSPKLADIDGDQIRDIVQATSDGTVHVFSLASGMPVEVPGFPVHTAPMDGLNPNPPVPSVPSYLSAPAYVNGPNGGVDPSIARESIVGPPAVADINGDGTNEIAFSTWSGTIYIVNSQGQSLQGWPIRLPLVPSCPLDPQAPKPPGPCMDLDHNLARGAFGAPVLVDMDGDGKLEVIQSAFDGNIYIFHADGTPLAGWPVLIDTPRAKVKNRILTTPAVADYNGDGIPDLVTGSNEEVGGGGSTGPVFLVDGRGMNTPGGPYLPNWPVVLTSLNVLPVVAEGINSSPAALDVNGDGIPEALLQGTGAPPFLLPTDPGPQQGFNDPPNILPLRANDPMTPRGFDPGSDFGELSTAHRPDSMFPALSEPSVGDLDQDGTPDVILSGGSLSLIGSIGSGGGSPHPFQHLLAMWSGKTGHMMPGSPIVLEDYTFFMNMAVADITGDDYPEVLLGTGAYFVRAVDACGREAAGWPKFTDGWIIASPAVGDIDGDSEHSLEVVTATREGFLYAWHTKGRQDGVIQWESFHHDNANTGNYDNKLAQGVLERATKPIDCSVPPPPPPPPSYNPGGCTLAGGVAKSRSPCGALGWLAALGSVALARRRRVR